MLPAIGYMIGFYIITRMLTILAPKDKAEKPIVVIMSVITLLVVIVSLLIITTSELRIADLPRRF